MACARALNKTAALTTKPINETNMKKLWLALIFFAGGIAHEVRNPVSCQCIASRANARPRQSTASTEDANT